MKVVGCPGVWEQMIDSDITIYSDNRDHLIILIIIVKQDNYLSTQKNRLVCIMDCEIVLIFVVIYEGYFVPRSQFNLMRCFHVKQNVINLVCVVVVPWTSVGVRYEKYSFTKVVEILRCYLRCGTKFL